MDEREALARIVADTQNVPFVGARQLKLADAILSSEWLAAHDRKVAAKALEEEAQRLEDMVSGYGIRDSGQLSAGRDIIRQIRARAATLRPTPSTETNGEQR